MSGLYYCPLFAHTQISALFLTVKNQSLLELFTFIRSFECQFSSLIFEIDSDIKPKLLMKHGLKSEHNAIQCNTMYLFSPHSMYFFIKLISMRPYNIRIFIRQHFTIFLFCENAVAMLP